MSFLQNFCDISGIFWNLQVTFHIIIYNLFHCFLILFHHLSFIYSYPILLFIIFSFLLENFFPLLFSFSVFLFFYLDFILLHFLLSILLHSRHFYFCYISLLFLYPFSPLSLGLLTFFLSPLKKIRAEKVNELTLLFHALFLFLTFFFSPQPLLSFSLLLPLFFLHCFTSFLLQFLIFFFYSFLIVFLSFSFSTTPLFSTFFPSSFFFSPNLTFLGSVVWIGLFQISLSF